MSLEEFFWFYDVFMSVGEDFDQQKILYIFQFLWRDLIFCFDVIGFYFICVSLWDYKFFLECVMRIIQVFILYQFYVRVLVCDGVLLNFVFMKFFCGYEYEQLFFVDGEDQFVVLVLL